MTPCRAKNIGRKEAYRGGAGTKIDPISCVSWVIPDWSRSNPIELPTKHTNHTKEPSTERKSNRSARCNAALSLRSLVRNRAKPAGEILASREDLDLQ